MLARFLGARTFPLPDPGIRVHNSWLEWSTKYRLKLVSSPRPMRVIFKASGTAVNNQSNTFCSAAASLEDAAPFVAALLVDRERALSPESRMWRATSFTSSCRANGRKAEAGITLDYMKKLHQGYENFIEEMENYTRVLILDWTQFLELDKVVERVSEKAKEKREFLRDLRNS